jgi:hypothetical protein
VNPVDEIEEQFLHLVDPHRDLHGVQFRSDWQLD